MQASTFGDIVVTPHHLSTSSALRFLSQGANAVEAAIAANAVQGVVAPETSGIGGDLFALIWLPDASSPLALNASGRAGQGADPAILADHGSIPIEHPLSVTVPGCVDGWHALMERFGTRSLAELMEPALELASGGFPASTELAGSLEALQGQLANQAAGTGLYTNGVPPAIGDRVSRPALASSLEAAAHSRDTFYLGTPGTAIREAVGGLIHHSDMQRNQATWVDPIQVGVFGRTGWTIPPNSQGYLTLAASRILELTGAPLDSVHHQIESYRSVAASRADLLAETGPLTPEELVAEERLRHLAGLIDSDRAGRWGAWSPLPAGTEYHCVVDRDGMAVSFIQSNYHGIGSGIGAGDAGFFLHDRGAGFTLTEGHPNQLAPGRRPAHTLSPSIWSRAGHLDSVLGTRGGDAQPQLLLQVAAAAFGVGLSPSDAQALPRWNVRGFDPGAATQVRLEPGLEDQLPTLEAAGHNVSMAGELQPGWGPVSLITVADTGLRTGAPDPRVDTASVGVL